MSPDAADTLPIVLDRGGATPLAQQIYRALRDAIHDGRLSGDSRLPSWRDLASTLGVARGTVRLAYERLVDEQLAVAHGAAGTRVARDAANHQATAGAARPHTAPPLPPPTEGDKRPWLPPPVSPLGPPPAFQVCVPAQDAFPYTLWGRIMARSAQTAATAPTSYPDPMGLPALRQEIAAYLAVARGVACDPAQIFITNGYNGALGLVLRGLSAFGLTPGATIWLEDPGFPVTRHALTLAGLVPVPVPVDNEGIDVTAGRQVAPAAKAALVTPGQQAPLGVTLSRARRLDLLAWAATANAWIIEDDYLGELQLNGRAAPALAALDSTGRVLYAGTFSKTISPALRLGFLVVPPALLAHFADVAMCLSPAPAATVQRAVATFLADGHFLRHLRRMKRLYAARQKAVLTAWENVAGPVYPAHPGNLAVAVALPPGTDDLAIVAAAQGIGFNPVPLSPWYAGPRQRSGLLLGVTNIPGPRTEEFCRRLHELLPG